MHLITCACELHVHTHVQNTHMCSDLDRSIDRSLSINTNEAKDGLATTPGALLYHSITGYYGCGCGPNCPMTTMTNYLE